MKTILKLSVVLVLVVSLGGMINAADGYELIFYEDFGGSKVSDEWEPDSARALVDPRATRLTTNKAYAGKQSLEFVAAGGQLIYSIPGRMREGKIEMYIYGTMD